MSGPCTGRKQSIPFVPYSRHKKSAVASLRIYNGYLQHRSVGSRPTSTGGSYSFCCWLLDRVFRQWWFDPALATACFAVFINWYWYHERRRGRSRDVSFRSACVEPQEGLDSIRSSSSSNHQSLRLLLDHYVGPMFQSLAAYWMGIYLWTSVVPPAAPHIPDGLPSSASEVLYLTAEVVTGIVLYDAIFFLIHWAMHGVPALRVLHARHHELQQSQPYSTSGSKSHHSATTDVPRMESRDVLRHSLADGALQVLVNILVQRRNVLWGPVKTRLARALHNIVVIWMLTESHSAVPTPNVWRRRWCPGVRDHYRHHTGRVNMTATTHHQQHHNVDECSETDTDDDDDTDSSSSKTNERSSSNHHRLRYQQFFGYLDDLREQLLLRKMKLE